MGALTNKPQAFNSRNWEYNSQITNDLTDFLTPRIRVDQFSGKIYRILPTVEWISNRIRFLYLGLKNQRVVTPLLTYSYNFEFDLSDRTINFSKKSLLTIRFEKAFSLLKSRLANNKKKNINLILGGVFDANLSFFNFFETKKTKINNYLEFNGNTEITKLPELVGSYLLFGVNPRMESPLLNLKIKETNTSVFSVGNFSFSYPVKVISNNFSSILLANTGKIMVELALFGLSSYKLSDLYLGKKAVILPIYYHNNLINYKNSSFRIKATAKEDFNIYLANQNLVESKEKKFSCIVTTHFEKLKGNNNSLIIPVSSYLETNISFKNKDLELETISSVKPSYGISDFALAFMLYSNSLIKVNPLKGIKIKSVNFLTKINNNLIANNVPNYLVRDPLGRANPLFNKI